MRGEGRRMRGRGGQHSLSVARVAHASHLHPSQCMPCAAHAQMSTTALHVAHAKQWCASVTCNGMSIVAAAACSLSRLWSALLLWGMLSQMHLLRPLRCTLLPCVLHAPLCVSAAHACQHLRLLHTATHALLRWRRAPTAKSRSDGARLQRISSVAAPAPQSVMHAASS